MRREPPQTAEYFQFLRTSPGGEEDPGPPMRKGVTTLCLDDPGPGQMMDQGGGTGAKTKAAEYDK